MEVSAQHRFGPFYLFIFFFHRGRNIQYQVKYIKLVEQVE